MTKIESTKYSKENVKKTTLLSIFLNLNHQTLILFCNGYNNWVVIKPQLHANWATIMT
jgi:hypothetical protein